MVINVDATNGLRATKCSKIDCSGTNTSTLVDTGIGNNAGTETSVAIGKDGLPVISYTAVTTGNIFKIAKCGNSACSSGNTVTAIDSTTDTGSQNSIKVGSDGLPVAAYYQITGQDLKVVKCGKPDCSSGNKITTVDTDNGVGQYPRIAISTDGLPFVSYYYGTFGYLKTVKCANAACSQTSGGVFSGGSSLGSIGTFFNNIYAAQFWGRQFQIAAFDLAEEYRSTQVLEAGDVVRVDDGGGANVVRADSGYQEGTIGVVSTEPGITLGDWTSQDRTNLYPIALAGRVPAKVTAENGEIKVGDPITSSATTPGYAMKATKAGRTIGIALEGTATGGKILVFVNPGWYDPGTVVDSDGDIAKTTGIGETEKVASLEAKTGTFETLTATVEAVFEKLTGKTVQIAKAVIKNLTVRKLEVGRENIGQAILPAGETKITIENPAVTGASKVLLTPKIPAEAPLAVTLISSGESFIVETTSPQDSDLPFDWWVVQ